MELITKELLINFLFILLPLLIMQMLYFLKYLYRLEEINEFWFIVSLLISMVMCMLFPFSLGNGLSWDLRRVPLLLGILYAGPKYGISLLFALLVVRYSLGGDGFFITIYAYVPMAFVAVLFSRYYMKTSLKHKLMSNVILVFISLLITYFAVTFIADVNLTKEIWVVYFLINIISIVIATGIWEVIKANLYVLQRLIKVEKLEVVSNLAASISHEVRNPLTASKGFMQLSAEGSVSQETKKFIRLSIQELDRATEIINDYLTFAKPAPEIEEKITIYKEISNAANVLTPFANMNGVEIELCPEKKELHYIVGERKKLGQALVNILKNGIESMENGGKLSIELTYGTRYIDIKITDRGKGMTQEQIARLGEPYFTTKEKGTGLGMMVTFSIIQSIGGKINVTSELNKGTCFMIQLPVTSG